VKAELPSGRSYAQRILHYTLAYSALAVGVVTLYLSGVLSLRPAQWRSFVEVVALAFFVIFPAMTLTHWRVFRTIQSCLDRRAAGVATAEELRRGFAVISDFPRYWFVWGIVWWAIGGCAVSGAMWLREPWFGALQASIVVCATVTVAFVTDTYYFFNIKRVLAPARTALAADLRDAGDRARLVRKVSLRTKLMASTTSVIILTVLFAGFLSHTRSRDALVESAARARVRSLAALTSGGEFDFEGAERRLAAAGSPLGLLLFDARAAKLLAGSAQGIDQAGIQQIRLRIALAARLEDAGSEGFVSWRRLRDEGPILAAVTPAAELAVGDGVGVAFTGLLFFATLVAIGVAYMAARDVGEATEVLEAQVASIAAGDLRGDKLLESEDEMGSLARSFEGMVLSLRNMVLGVSAAADGMHSALEAISGASRSVAAATAAQVGGIAGATDSMGRIDGQVRGIAGSAEHLDRDVDQASSSLIELESTGGELSQGASALFSGVDEMAGSIDEIAQSIARVHESSVTLASVADDTSVSMEQAASGMRDVSSTSEEMSRLSCEVIGIAEEGQDRVQQTIRGMGDIHESTESVRRVIASLADGAVQIDGVIGVIDGVADETSLLALNAAIIAAQAGEHGRAFAVVAAEVRALAKRVLESTKTITDLIHTVQRESGDATGAIARGGESVNRGIAFSSDAGSALDAITRTARVNGERIAEVVASVEEQTRAVAVVADLMTRLRAGTGQIRQAADEQDSSMRLLRESANQMGAAAKQVEHATEEQAQGTTGIRQNMDSVRASVGQINRALHEQSEACGTAVESLQALQCATDSNRESVTQLDDATRGLEARADELRREVARFRI